MSGDLSRRRALQIAALGAAGTVVGGVGTWRSLLAPADGSRAGRPGRLLREPSVRESRGGALDVDLVAGRGVTVAGRETDALGYNGMSPGPTLRVHPGDRLRVTLTNRLTETTNLHTHGLHVSPEGDSDNIFRAVGAGASARYEYLIPEDHPTGTFWYHPHHHGVVADQVFGGLFGTLVVAGAGEPEVARERVLVVSDITLADDGSVAPVSFRQQMAGREGDLVLVNGQLQPRIEMGGGAVERWRVVNACTSRFLRLRLDGHSWGLLGYDGQALGAPEDRSTIVLAPGNRADVLVRPGRSGTFGLRTLAYDRGGMGMMAAGPEGTSPQRELATVRVGPAGASAGQPSGAPTRPGPIADLRGRRVDRRRTVTFTMGMGMGGMSFGFDGREFDMGRTDQRLRLDTVEEWILANDTPMDHPFHLHVWPMQVVDAPDLPASGRPDWRDVVIVPAHDRVRVRIRFADFGGRTVYHCHILDHEDRGMMAVVEAG